MGQRATISLGVVIANQSVPLAIALEQLWEAEEKAKEHPLDRTREHTCDRTKDYICDCTDERLPAKDAVQVRVIYSNGNTLNATCKLDTFAKWRALLEVAIPNPENLPALYEQAAEQWKQFPCPLYAAIAPWTTAFIDRRDAFRKDEASKKKFRDTLSAFLQGLWETTQDKAEERKKAVTNWLRLAAFILRKRKIS